MTLSEFKAWFEGYTEGLEAAPTKAQFDRIKEKVKEISGTPVTHTVFVDRYIQPYQRYWGAWGGTMDQTTSGGTLSATRDAQMYNGAGAAFDSHSAMYALGKAEAQIAA